MAVGPTAPGGACGAMRAGMTSPQAMLKPRPGKRRSPRSCLAGPSCAWHAACKAMSRPSRCLGPYDVLASCVAAVMYSRLSFQEQDNILADTTWTCCMHRAKLSCGITVLLLQCNKALALRTLCYRLTGCSPTSESPGQTMSLECNA